MSATAKKPSEQAIYSNYRAALKKGDKDVMVAQRKQHARQVTADRYHVPISEVKAIVKKMDAENGIIHEVCKREYCDYCDEYHTELVAPTAS